MPSRQPLRVKSFSVRAFEAELKRPFITSLGRKTSTTNVAIILTLSDGSSGYGEASASLALARLQPKILAGTLTRLGQSAVGQDAAPERLIARAWREAKNASPAAAAFECALLDAWLAARGLSLSQWLGGKLREARSDITISADDAAQSFAAAKQARDDGFDVLKIKIDGDLPQSLARLKAVRRAASKAVLRLDGNQGLSVDGSLRLLDACRKENFAVELLEQPLPKWDYRGLSRLSRRASVPIAVDESVSTPEDALRVAGEGCAQIINIKIAKSGIGRSLEIASIARAAGLDLMIGCMCETAAGLSAGVHLALGTGFFRYVDLDSDWLLCPLPMKADWLREGSKLRLRGVNSCRYRRN